MWEPRIHPRWGSVRGQRNELTSSTVYGGAADSEESRLTVSVGLDRQPFLLGPLRRELARRARRIHASIEATADDELFVLEELRLDAVLAVVTQLA